MPFLGDYLGHLLSEITTARLQADLEAVRVADLYASHPLLKSLPIPRFRLPTITLDVPVAVSKMEEAKPGESPRGGVPIAALRERFGAVLDQQLARAKVQLSAAERTKLDEALNLTVSNTTTPASVGTSSTRVADDLVATTLQNLDPQRVAGADRSAPLEELAADLRTAARAELLALATPPPRLEVLVTTAELRDAGPRELLAQLHLSVSEEAFEWSFSDAQGQARSKLIPE